MHYIKRVDLTYTTYNKQATITTYKTQAPQQQDTVTPYNYKVQLQTATPTNSQGTTTNSQQKANKQLGYNYTEPTNSQQTARVQVQRGRPRQTKRVEMSYKIQLTTSARHSTTHNHTTLQEASTDGLQQVLSLRHLLFLLQIPVFLCM